MRTVTLHKLLDTKATTVAAVCPQGRSYQGSGTPSLSMRNRPWSNEILVEGAAFARGSNDPIQEALL
jgi:hypothetical protein